MWARIVQTIWVVSLVGGLFGSSLPPAAGQSQSPIDASAVYTAEMTTNLFAAPAGQDPIDGWVVQLPDGWALERTVVLRYGSEPVTTEVRSSESTSNAYAIVLDRRQRGPHEVILQVTVGSEAGRDVWSIAPFTYDSMEQRMVHDGRRITRHVEVQAVPMQRATTSSADRYALAFGAGDPMLLQAEALPRFAANQDFTVEFWMKTTGLDEVLLSTWPGEEDTPYPLEIIVDPSGRLRYYWGMQGRHTSLTTRAPVADGHWHHIAIVHRADRQRLVLLREGQPIDSLRNVALPTIRIDHLALGGRPTGAHTGRNDETTAQRYSGQFDELRLWATARSADAIQSAAQRVLAATPEGVQLRFEEDAPSDFVVAWPEHVRRVPATLPFIAPLQNLQAVVEDETVRLSWEVRDPSAEGFVIERSAGGRDFEAVGRVQSQDVLQDGRYEFIDPAIPGQVVYYRIRQQFEDGTDRVSGTLKIGLGAPDAETEKATLIGNFPNPFSETTTIAYEVNETQPLQLTVWDVSGQRVTTLIDETHTPGYYEHAFEATSLPSGTYFVRLQAEDVIASHRMVVLR